MKKIIHPKSPSFSSDLNLGVTLTKDHVDISGIEKLAKAKGFREQTIRHITILSERTFVPLFNKFTDSQKPKIMKEIKKLINKTDWSFIPGKIYYVAGNLSARVTRSIPEYRESFVRVVEMPDIDNFIIQLNKILKSEIPFRFSHITLFTKGGGKNPFFYGIPIGSKEEFDRLHTKEII